MSAPAPLTDESRIVSDLGADVDRPFLAGKRPLAGRGTSNLGLLRHLKGIVDLDAEIANRAF